jgi:hypothetical protein
MGNATTPSQGDGFKMTMKRRLSGYGLGAALPVAAATTMSLLAALPATPAQAQSSGVDLKVLTPRSGDSLGSAQFSLDVSFDSKSASPVVTAELWVDGVRWARRDLDAPQVKNVLSFAVDGSSLAAGKHTIVVKVFTAANGVSQVTLPVYAGNNRGEVSGSISGPDLDFKSLTNGQKIAGTVELSLDAKEANGVHPYVTIYVDKQFKTLKNYPPYSYVWDTTKVANGYHTIEATGYLDANGASSTRTMKVFVDNPGGNTDIKTDVPDLGAARETINPTAATTAVKPLAIPLPGKTVLRPEGEPVSTPVAVATPALKMSSANIAPVKSASIAAPTTRVATLLPATVATRTASKAANAPTAAKMQEAPLVAPSAAVTVARVAPVAPVTLAAPKPVAKVASKPAVTATAVVAAPPVAVVTTKTVVRNTVTTQSAPRAAVRPVAVRGVLNNNADTTARKGIQVAFDGQQIAFDVQPRVEAGLPLAPFRQIFEHTGGQVMWVKDTQVVRAVNADREVVIKVGANKAKVNGETFTMARPAFVEQGRTIVPLSFVGQALDVDVKYDPATGRLQITSKN